MSRSVSAEPSATDPVQPLAAIDSAQKKHDAMKFYTRLTQKEVPGVAEHVAEPESGLTESKAAPEAVAALPREETAKQAIARIGQPKPSAMPITRKIQAQAGQFTVQVSAFQTSEEAEAYKSSLARKGYRPYVIPAEIPGKGTWYRVRVGRYDDKNAATEAKAQLALVNIPSFIVEAH